MDSRSFAFLTSPIWVTLVPMYLLCHPPWLPSLAQPDANPLLVASYLLAVMSMPTLRAGVCCICL